MSSLTKTFLFSVADNIRVISLNYMIFVNYTDENEMLQLIIKEESAWFNKG